MIDKHGRLDILINNAGITIDKDRRRDDGRRLAQRARREPLGRILPVPGRAGPQWSSEAAGASSTCRRSSEKPAISARRTTPHPRPDSSG
ncbi:hypothetical protein [Mycolicibacterium moriokaense]|uniref:hypothetical protein n=1 Tax=Mycolicibacterium moriokaense TaxID=39691 RepID=UPI003C6E05EE